MPDQQIAEPSDKSARVVVPIPMLVAVAVVVVTVVVVGRGVVLGRMGHAWQDT